MATNSKMLAAKMLFFWQSKVMQISRPTTGQSLSEALIFASTNPQYKDRLFIELQVQYMKIPSSNLGENMLCIEIVSDIQNNSCT